MTQLHQAIASRTEALAAHTTDVEALARGRERLTGAQAELDRLSGEDTEAIAQHARRLTAQTREGRNGPLPALVASDTLLAAQITAQRTHAAAQQMVASLVDAEKRSAAELAGAERIVQDAERVIDTALVRRLDAKRTALLRELDSVTEMIAAVAIDSPSAVPPDVDARCNAQVSVLTIELALQQSRHVVRDINTSIGTRLAAIEAARERWREFRAQSLADDDTNIATEVRAA